MNDVFISFTTRAGTTLDWVVALRNNLKKAYLAKYGRDDLDIWDMSKNLIGDDFAKKISAALENTLMLILVLDPAFDSSPQVKVEINKYQSERAKVGEPPLIIKIIKTRGDRDDELRALVDRNLILTYFSKIKSNNTEQEFKEGSNDYNEEIGRIVEVIREHKVQQQLKVNSQKLLARLNELKDIPTVYVALGDSEITENRRKFISQLTQTILHHNSGKISQVKIIPDDITLAGVTYEELSDLLCKENDYRELCVEAMLDNCCAAIVVFETDNIAEGEQLLERMRFQLRHLKVRGFDLKRKLPVHLLLNLPKELLQSEDFKNELDNPAYSTYNNIKLVKNQIITLFIESFVEDLKRIVESVPVVPGVDAVEVLADPIVQTEKKIYIIEYNNPNRPDLTQDELEAEETNKAKLWEYITNQNFTLIDRFYFENEAALSDAFQKHKESLKISDGVIIYRGLGKDNNWCRLQQSETYKAISALVGEKKGKDLKRAVFVDPLLENRQKGSYLFYKYSVITDSPPELDAFLCQVRQY